MQLSPLPCHPVNSSLLGPNTLLNTLFPNTLSLRSSLNVSDQVSHLLGHTITNKIIKRFVYRHRDVGSIGWNYAEKVCSKKPAMFQSALFSSALFIT
jgi:hypothetical protein